MVEETAVVQAMKKATEPATGITLFDLGLIDDVTVKGDSVHVKIVPHCNCPLLPILLEDIYQAAADVPGVSHVEIDVDWDLKWDPSRLSTEGRKVLGLK